MTENQTEIIYEFSAVQMSEAFWMWSIELSVYEKVDFSRQIFREPFWGSGVFGKKLSKLPEVNNDNAITRHRFSRFNFTEFLILV